MVVAYEWYYVQPYITLWMWVGSSRKKAPPLLAQNRFIIWESYWVRITLYSVAVSLPSKWTSGPTQPFPLHLSACRLHFFLFRNIKKFIWNAWVPDAPCSSWADVHLLWEQLLGVRTTTPFKDNLQNRKWAHNKFALGRGSSVQLTSWSRL